MSASIETRPRVVQRERRRDHVRVAGDAGAEPVARLLHFLLGETLALARGVHLLARRRDVEHRAAHVERDLLAQIAAAHFDVARHGLLLLRLRLAASALEHRPPRPARRRCTC